MDRFYLDPLDGEKRYPDEPAYTDYIGKLPLGEAKLCYANGYTNFSPKGPLVVGCCYDFKLIYYPYDRDLEAGTQIKFSIPRTWTQPQNEKIGAGYVSVQRKTARPVKVWFTQNENSQWWICVEIIDDIEPSDGYIKVEYNQSTIQRFPQDKFDNWRNALRTVIFSDNKSYSVVPGNKTEKPTIISAPPAYLNIAGPAVAKSGEKVDIKFSILDYCNNLAHPFIESKIYASMLHSPFNPIASTSISINNQGYGSLKVEVPEDLKSFQIALFDKKDNLYNISPNIIIDPKPEINNVYFGDIHAKTELTDGLKTPGEYYKHARDVALLDFAAIADHNDYESSYIEGPFTKQMSDGNFKIIQEACEKYNQEGRFITIQGFEQSRLEDYNGHVNIYFRNQCPGIFKGNSIDELYEYLKGHQALVIPHHTIIWNTRVQLENVKYFKIIEMYSMHCNSEEKGTPINNYETTANKIETGQSAREILAMGHRVGFIAASDNHNGAPGLSAKPSRFTNLTYSGGLAAVISPVLTRESIFDSLYNRRCYATSGRRIYLDFKVEGHMMGSEITIKNNKRALKYEITVGGTDKIAYIEMIQSDKVSKIWNYDGSLYVNLDGIIILENPSDWFYVRVTQVDRHMAWSSPIWVDIET